MPFCALLRKLPEALKLYEVWSSNPLLHKGHRDFFFKSSLSLRLSSSPAPSPKPLLKPIRERLENTRVHKPPLPTWMHTLAARPSSGTDLQCCWAVVSPRWVTERGEKRRERARESSYSCQLQESTSVEVLHEAHSSNWEPSYQTMEAKKWRSRKGKGNLVTEQQTRFSSGITGTLPACSHVTLISFDILWDPSLIDRSPSLCWICPD